MIKALMPNSFFEQNTTVNDKSTAGRFDPKVFVNCVQDQWINATMSLYSIMIKACMHANTPPDNFLRSLVTAWFTAEY